MNKYYSILYLQIRPYIKERISIALLIREDNNVYFKYSKDKLNNISRILDANKKSLALSILKGIEEEVNEIKANKRDGIFNDKSIKKLENYSIDYIKSLEKYPTNIITFSEPKKLDTEINQGLFNKLFEELVAPIETDRKENKPRIIKVRSKLITLMKNKLNTNVKTNKYFSDDKHKKYLMYPDVIDLLGKNGKIMSGQVIDFEKRFNYLQNDLTTYLQFRNEVSADGENFIIGMEPNRRMEKNHSLWQQVRNLNELKYVDSSDVEKFIELVNKNNYQPMFEFEDRQ